MTSAYERFAAITKSQDAVVSVSISVLVHLIDQPFDRDFSNRIVEQIEKKLHEQFPATKTRHAKLTKHQEWFLAHLAKGAECFARAAAGPGQGMGVFKIQTGTQPSTWKSISVSTIHELRKKGRITTEYIGQRCVVKLVVIPEGLGCDL